MPQQQVAQRSSKAGSQSNLNNLRLPRPHAPLPETAVAAAVTAGVTHLVGSAVGEALSHTDVVSSSPASTLARGVRQAMEHPILELKTVTPKPGPAPIVVAAIEGATEYHQTRSLPRAVAVGAAAGLGLWGGIAAGSSAAASVCGTAATFVLPVVGTVSAGAACGAIGGVVGGINGYVAATKATRSVLDYVAK